MFENVGEKIKGLAKLFYTIGVLIAIIIGIWAFYSIGNLLDDVFLALFSAALIIGIGIFFSWGGVLLLYAFGDLVENTAQIRANFASFGSNENSNISTEEITNSKDQSILQESFIWHPVVEANAIATGENNIKCTNCHKVQFKGNTTCNRCGAKFILIDE